MAGKNDVSGDLGAARGKEAKRVGGAKLGGSTPVNKLKKGK